MSCCGKNREQLLQESNSQHTYNAPPTFNNDNPIMNNKPSRSFKYIGKNSLTLQGIYSGKMYAFKHTGYILEVDFEDSLPFMAENELIPIRNHT